MDAQFSGLARPARNGHSYLDEAVIEPHHDAVAEPRKLDRNEFLRRLWHFVPGIVALIAALAPKVDSVAGTFLICIIAASALVVLSAIRYQKCFCRSSEKNCLPAILGYMIPSLTMICLFPDFPEITLTIMTVVAFGDGTATICGMLYGSSRLPWNAKKSWIGTVAFVAAAFPMGAFVYYCTAIPGVSLPVAMICAGTSALFAAVIESLPMQGNDNFRVGTAAMAGVLLMQALLVGF